MNFYKQDILMLSGNNDVPMSINTYQTIQICSSDFAPYNRHFTSKKGLAYIFAYKITPTLIGRKVEIVSDNTLFNQIYNDLQKPIDLNNYIPVFIHKKCDINTVKVHIGDNNSLNLRNFVCSPSFWIYIDFGNFERHVLKINTPDIDYEVGVIKFEPRYLSFIDKDSSPKSIVLIDRITVDDKDVDFVDLKETLFKFNYTREQLRYNDFASLVHTPLYDNIKIYVQSNMLELSGVECFNGGQFLKFLNDNRYTMYRNVSFKDYFSDVDKDDIFNTTITVHVEKCQQKDKKLIITRRLFK